MSENWYGTRLRTDWLFYFTVILSIRGSDKNRPICQSCVILIFPFICMPLQDRCGPLIVLNVDDARVVEWNSHVILDKSDVLLLSSPSGKLFKTLFYCFRCQILTVVLVVPVVQSSTKACCPAPVACCCWSIRSVGGVRPCSGVRLTSYQWSGRPTSATTSFRQVHVPLFHTSQTQL